MNKSMVDRVQAIYDQLEGWRNILSVITTSLDDVALTNVDDGYKGQWLTANLPRYVAALSMVSRGFDYEVFELHKALYDLGLLDEALSLLMDGEPPQEPQENAGDVTGK